MVNIGKRKPIDYGVVGSIIGEDAEFKGEINTKGSVRVSGLFEGKINAAGDVLVSDGSKIMGNIVGGRVVVSGDVSGNIFVSEGLEITKTGRVYGDITGIRLIVDEGAIYKGKVNMEVKSSKGLVEKEISQPLEEAEVERIPEPPSLYEELTDLG
ncbi:MAG: polymer-forming cytoskeletal protein [Candidatus Saganbacteria bacterium]|nr:polymer-forming cytoskeletal protein [Candidatus Saganbacteria bacterium]